MQCLISCLTGAGNWAGLVAGQFLCLQSAKLSASHLLKPPSGRGSGLRNRGKKEPPKSISSVSLETTGNKKRFCWGYGAGRRSCDPGKAGSALKEPLWSWFCGYLSGIYSDSKGLKICLGFWIHMLWIYSQKLKACTQLLPYKLQSHLQFLSSLQLKAEHPSSCLGLVSWAQHVNTKLGEDLSGCLLTTAGGSRVTENRLSSRLVGRKLLLAVANIQRGSTKNNVTLLPALLEASQVWKMRKQWTAGIPSNWDHPIGFSRSANFVFSPFMPIVLIIFIHPSQINIPKKGLETNPSSICP